jgi:MoxR-like ATPase
LRRFTKRLIARSKAVACPEGEGRATAREMLKGPTGCGKTRFVEHMARRLAKPLVTAAAHDDMTASDLAGRYLLEPDRMVRHN